MQAAQRPRNQLGTDADGGFERRDDGRNYGTHNVTSFVASAHPTPAACKRQTGKDSKQLDICQILYMECPAELID
jgi:hypothetical protein